MLVGADGRPLGPTPMRASATRGSEEMERGINEELGRLDELLHIRWMPFAVGIPGGRREGRYALCSYWPSVDPRREQVRNGQYDPADAFDIIGWFCEDVQSAYSVPQEPASIMRKVLDLLHSCDNSRFPWRTRMAECIEANKRRQEKVKQDGVEEIRDLAADAYWHSGRAHRVFQSSTGGR